jgi:dipeptidyl aminopeptidase/acylaminoacyl peptidase
VREIFRHSTLDAWQLTPDGQGVVYISRAIDSPTELYHRSLGDDSPRPLTRFNETLLREVDVRSPEELWLDGDQGKKVHVFLVKPHDFDPAKKYPLILNVHGGPQGMWADSYRGDWQVYPGKGYVLAFANPTGSTGYGQALTDRIACDWGGEVYRDLMKITDQLEALPYVDGDRMGAMGWSFGGYMMMWFEGHTERFKALAAMMGLYDLPSFYGATEELWFPDKDLCGQPWNSEHYRRWSPSESVANFKTPALVITGEKDYRVPYTQSLQFFTALQLQGVDSRLVVFPGAGHWPGWYEMAFYYLAHVDWFHRYLGGGEPPWDVEAFLRNAVFSKEDPEKPASEK